MPCPDCQALVSHSIEQWRRHHVTCPECGSEFAPAQIDKLLQQSETRQRNLARSFRRVSKW